MNETKEAVDTGNNRIRLSIELTFDRRLSKRQRWQLQKLLSAMKKLLSRLAFVNADVEVGKEEAVYRVVNHED